MHVLRLLANVLLTGIAGLLAGVVLLMLLLPLAGQTSPEVTASTSAAGALTLGLVPFVVGGIAAVVGLTLSIGGTVGVVRARAGGTRASAPAALSDAVSSLPRVVVLVVATPVVFVVTAVLWPVVSLVLLVAAARAARAGDHDRARSRLLSAIPCAISLRVLVTAATAYGSLLGGHPLRTAVTAAWARPLRQQLVVGVLLAGTAVAGWLVGLAATALVVRWQAPTTTAGDSAGSDFYIGTALLAALVVVWTSAVGSLLGVAAHVGAEPSLRDRDADGAGWRGSAERRFFRGRRTRRAAVVLTMAVLAQTAASLSTPSEARAAFPGDLVVTTLDDGAPTPGECVDPGVSCGVRAALAEAARLAAASAEGEGSGSVEVRVAVSGTISLVDTLVMAAGTSLTATGGPLTLDAHQDFRALRVVGPDDGSLVGLTGVAVVGGRSDTAGAGLLSEGPRVFLSEATFRDNVAATGDGGALRAPFVSVDQSAFTGNRALAGSGGAVHADRVSWTNSTSVEDRGGVPTGGAVSGADVTVQHGTVVDGGGVAAAGFLSLLNSIVQTAGATSCAAAESTAAGNIDPSGACAGALVSPETGDPVTADPLGPLADNGGSTPTVALLTGSPALGAGDEDACLGSDQRGRSRTSPACDVGAFESQEVVAPSYAVTLEAGAEQRVELGRPLPVLVRVTAGSLAPVGTVDVLDAGRVVAADLPLDEEGVARAELVLDHGRRLLTAEFTPADDPDAPAYSEEVVRDVRSPVALTLDVTGTGGEVVLHQRATFTVEVAAAPPAGTAADPALRPTGVVQLQNGERLTEIELVDGSVTWRVDRLASSNVSVSYVGDDAFDGGLAYGNGITTRAIPTTTTLTAPAVTGYAGQLTARVGTSDEAGPAPGRVTVLVDGVELRTVSTDGSLDVDLGRLPVGDHVVTATFAPGDSGRAASAAEPLTIRVVPASTSVVLEAPGSVGPFEFFETTVTVTGGGTSVVRLLDGERVLDSVEVGFPARVTLFARQRLSPGFHQLTADVVGSDTAAASTSSPVTVLVRRETTELSTVVRPAAPGQESEIEVGAPAEADGALTLTDTATGAVLATGTLLQGAGTLRWSAATAGPTDVTVSYEPTEASPWAAAAITVGVVIPRREVATPTLTWNDDPHPGDSFLTVVFPDPTVTGEVTLRLGGSGLTTAPVVDGRAVLELTLASPACPCDPVRVIGALEVRYAGDDSWAPRSFDAPTVVLTPTPTTTVLDVPALVAVGDVIRLAASVTSESPRFVQGLIVFTVDGVDLPGVRLRGDGTVATTHTPGRYGTTSVVGARYVPDTFDHAASAAERTVVLAAAAAPRVELTADGAPVIGQPLPVTAVVRDGRDRVPNGSVLYLVDEQDGRLLGSTTFVDGVARGTVVPDRGGVLRLVGRFAYLPDDETGSTQVVVLDVPPAATPLRVEIVRDPAAAAPLPGETIRVQVTADLTEPQWQRTGPFAVVLLDDAGRQVGGPVELGTQRRLTSFLVTPGTKGLRRFDATTLGDGGELGRGAASATILAVGYPASLTLPFADGIRRGDGWTPGIRVTGVDDPTGPVSVVVTAADGSVAATCEALVEDLRGCTFPGGTFAEGRYDVRATYAGDPTHEGATGSGTLAVGLSATSIRTTFDPPLDRRDAWVVGEQVTARWRIGLPDGAPLLGTVVVDGDLGVLCETRAEAGQCTFTVRPRTASPLRSIVVRSTFVPADLSLSPSVDLADGRTPARCLPVSVAPLLRDPYRGLPGRAVLDGRTCSAGLAPGTSGFVEGTEVTVDYSGVVGPDERARYRVQGLLAESPAGDPVEVPVDLGLDLGAALGDEQLDETLVFVLERAIVLRPVVVYAPRCVTVELTGQGGATVVESGDVGGLTTTTVPNCADPVTATLGELADLERGRLRVAVDTPVTVTPRYPVNRLSDGARIGYDLAGIEQVADDPLLTVARPDDLGTGSWTAVVTASGRLSPRFVVADTFCTPVAVRAGQGGTVSVERSALPDLPGYARFGLTDDAGCQASSGAAGYRPQSTLGLSAVGDLDPSRRSFASSQYWFEGWADDVSAPGTPLLSTGIVPPVDLSPTETGVQPGDRSAYAPQGRDVVVPSRLQALEVVYGARFGHVVCGSVELSSGESLPSAAAAFARERVLPPTTCPAWDLYLGTDQRRFYRPGSVEVTVPGTVHEELRTLADGTRAAPDEFVGVSTRTASLRPVVTEVRGGDLVKTIKTRPVESGDFFESEIGLVVNGTTGTVVEPVRDSLRFYVGIAADTVTRVEARYSDEECAPPRVRVYPAGYARVTGRSPGCPDGQLDPNRPGATLTIDRFRGSVAPRLTAFAPTFTALERVRHSPDYTDLPDSNKRTEWSPTYPADSYTIDVAMNNASTRLEFCVPVSVGVQVVDPAGDDLSGFDVGRDILETGSECRGRDESHVASITPVGLRSGVSAWFDPLGGPSEVVVDLEGNTRPARPFELQVRCATLSTPSGRVDVDTPADCPYAGGRRVDRSYLRGSTVMLSYDRSNSTRHEGWTGADYSNGTTAAVVMVGDRSVSAVWKKLAWYEEMGAVLSTVTQRVIAVAVTAVTGLILAEFLLFQLATLALKGVAVGLRAAGVRGKGLDSVEKVADIGLAQLELAGSLATCTNQWATGGTGDALTYGMPSGNGSAGQDAVDGVTYGAVNFGATGAQFLANKLSQMPDNLPLITTGWDLGNTLAANNDNYFDDPAETWGNIGDIGGCMKDKGDSYAAKYGANTGSQ